MCQSQSLGCVLGFYRNGSASRIILLRSGRKTSTVYTPCYPRQRFFELPYGLYTFSHLFVLDVIVQFSVLVILPRINFYAGWNNEIWLLQMRAPPLVLERLFFRRNWAPLASECVSLFEPKGGGDTLPCGWGRGGAQFRRRDRKPGTLYTLWLHVTICYFNWCWIIECYPFLCSDAAAADFFCNTARLLPRLCLNFC